MNIQSLTRKKFGFNSSVPFGFLRMLNDSLMYHWINQSVNQSLKHSVSQLVSQ